LGSGESIGFSWQWGVLTSLYDAGIDLLDVKLMVGTSVGSTAAVELTMGDPHRMLDHILADEPRERNSPPATDAFVQMLGQAIGRHSETRAILAEIGALALQAGGAPTDKMQEIVVGSLRVPEWPKQQLLIPAVDARTGELMVFTRESDVSLVDAMCASCALPGVWTPFALGGRHYIDGSTRSSTNADLAAGCDRVLVVAPVNGIRGIPGASFDESLEPVRQHGEGFLIKPDSTSKQAMGRDVFDMSRRVPAVRAGLVQGELVATAVKDFWLC
jgi:NTE family protein